jgi:hypothetical protein
MKLPRTRLLDQPVAKTGLSMAKPKGVYSIAFGLHHYFIVIKFMYNDFIVDIDVQYAQGLFNVLTDTWGTINVQRLRTVNLR